jgi:hypothetical protein
MPEMSVFENRILRKVFGRKKEELTGIWRKLHNEEPHNSYSSTNIIWSKNKKNNMGTNGKEVKGA